MRKWKNKATLGVKATKWEFEVGEQLVPRNLDSEGMLESSANVRARNLRLKMIIKQFFINLKYWVFIQRKNKELKQ